MLEFIRQICQISRQNKIYLGDKYSTKLKAAFLKIRYPREIKSKMLINNKRSNTFDLYYACIYVLKAFKMYMS